MTAELAKRIYQENLDAVSKALMDGDLREMMRHIAIPNMMSTHDTEIVMSSPEELDIVMTDFRAQLLARGVEVYTRTCLEADFVVGRDDMIAGHHRTETEGADGVAVNPYLNHMVLMRIDGRWMGIWLQAILKNTELEILSPDIAAAQAEARRMLDKIRR
ncbi:hypothetical protein [Marivita sp. XM-24bin2]|jgi:hypothetical protein|uniref:hypothetical protein n=1 Tax=unclassified Marivita TaxID=2632480 RepID=UPI000D7A9743|nr:hypothetical protein [Marivita sp. XM-24bin2]MCR9109921.1 hypothetical protein [Paracoccaceae bacterium]PWL36391.1 MAG: hypothetical protein DCO97_04080 [Marivita sp. XM-24bin2]